MDVVYVQYVEMYHLQVTLCPATYGASAVASGTPKLRFCETIRKLRTGPQRCTA